MARKALVAAGNVWGGAARPSVEWWPHDQSDARYRELCRYDAATGLVQVEYLEAPPEPPAPRASSPGAPAACPSTYKLDWSSRERRKLAIEQAEAQTAARAAAAACLARQLASLRLDAAPWAARAPPAFVRHASSSSSSLSELGWARSPSPPPPPPPPRAWPELLAAQAWGREEPAPPLVGEWRPEPPAPPTAAAAARGQFDLWDNSFRFDMN